MVTDGVLGVAVGWRRGSAAVGGVGGEWVGNSECGRSGAGSVGVCVVVDECVFAVMADSFNIFGVEVWEDN